MKWLFTTLLLVATPTWAQSDLACKVISIHMESRGESLRASKAVLQVIQNRMRIQKKTACQVVLSDGQFPWAAKKRSWKFTQNMLTRYFKLVNMLPVVSNKVYYFNHHPVKWGKPYKRIGKLYFNLKGETNGRRMLGKNRSWIARMGV